MLGNRLLKFSLFSLFLHLGLLFLITPIFYYSSNSEIEPVFLGRFKGLGKISLVEKSFYNTDLFRWPLEDFLVSSPSKLFTYLKKISKEFVILEKELPFLEKEVFSGDKNFSFFYCIETNRVELGSFERLVSSEVDGFLKKDSSQKIKLSLLISPQGRVVWIKGLDFLSDFQLASQLECKLRNFLFSAKGIYYWKNIEIVVK